MLDHPDVKICFYGLRTYEASSPWPSVNVVLAIQVWDQTMNFFIGSSCDPIAYDY